MYLQRIQRERYQVSDAQGFFVVAGKVGFHKVPVLVDNFQDGFPDAVGDPGQFDNGFLRQIGQISQAIDLFGNLLDRGERS